MNWKTYSMQRVKVILGPGSAHVKQAGELLVDVLDFEGVDIIHDLNITPWPIHDGLALHINASHIVEHLKSLPAFMDECWRLCHPGGTLYIETPDANGPMELVWADPTHVRPYVVHTWINYYTVEGIEKFGVSKHAWSILFIQSKGGIIRLHLMPLPDECLTDETLKRKCYGIENF